MRGGNLTLVAGGLAVIGCTTPRTEILLAVDSDLTVPAELDQVQIRIESESTKTRFEKVYDLGPGRAALPLSIGMVPDRDRSVAFRAVAVGSHEGTTLVERSALTSFVPDQTLELRLELLRACRGVRCGAGQTCLAGTCGPDEVDPKDLTRLGHDAGTRDQVGGADTPTADVAMRPRGAACSAHGDCLTTYCVDGVCCDSGCADLCKTCKRAGAIGSCAAVTDADDPDTCSGTNTCNASGACKKRLGIGCSGPADCSSAFCVDSICCATACNGSGDCYACNVAGKLGTCAPVAAYSEHAGCSLNKACDGKGECKIKDGASCACPAPPSQCISGLCCAKAGGPCCGTCLGVCRTSC